MADRTRLTGAGRGIPVTVNRADAHMGPHGSCTTSTPHTHLTMTADLPEPVRKALTGEPLRVSIAGQEISPLIS